MENILVTTDLSPESRCAFPVALEHAKLSTNSKITLLCVLEDLAETSIQFAFGFALMDKDGVKEAIFTRVSNELRSIAESEFPGVEVEPVLIPAVGQVYKSILKFADNERFDLVVIATHGHTGVRRLLVGSVAEHIIRESSIPVLVVPTKKN